MTKPSKAAVADTGYEAFARPTSGGELAQLAELADQQSKAAAKVAGLEADLLKAKEELRDLAEFRVPELMDQVGMDEFKTSTGLKIKIKENIRASIPAAAAPRAFAWLREHGNAAMIKRTLSIAFGKGEDEKAAALVTTLTEQGYEADDKSAVHPSTLSAFVREKLRDGEEIPLDLFGVHRQRVSEIQN